MVSGYLPGGYVTGHGRSLLLPKGGPSFVERRYLLSTPAYSSRALGFRARVSQAHGFSRKLFESGGERLKPTGELPAERPRLENERLGREKELARTSRY
jgi:hypothetical protein